MCSLRSCHCQFRFHLHVCVLIRFFIVQFLLGWNETTSSSKCIGDLFQPISIPIWAFVMPVNIASNYSGCVCVCVCDERKTKTLRFLPEYHVFDMLACMYEYVIHQCVYHWCNQIVGNVCTILIYFFSLCIGFIHRHLRIFANCLHCHLPQEFHKHYVMRCEQT